MLLFAPPRIRSQKDMRLQRRRFLELAASIVAAPYASSAATAQAYPLGVVRIVLGSTPGGGTDIIARLMGQWLSDRFNQFFIVDDRPGAGSNIATEVVVRAAPDGQTLLLVTTANAINAHSTTSLHLISCATSSRFLESPACRLSWW